MTDQLASRRRTYNSHSCEHIKGVLEISGQALEARSAHF